MVKIFIMNDIYIYNFFKKKPQFLLKKICQSHVIILIMSRVADMKIRQFWIKKIDGNGGIIFVFFYSTCSTYEKNKN
jgi:hypothetical protein